MSAQDNEGRVRTPFEMSFGELKRLLISEEVIGPGCKDTQIREHLAGQTRDKSVLAQPLKYQMAWLVKELDLHQGFGSSMANPLHAWANTAPQLLLDRPSRSVSPSAVSYISDSGGGSGRRPQVARRVVGPTNAPPPLPGQGSSNGGSGSRANSRSSTPRRGSNASSARSGGPREPRPPLTGSSNSSSNRTRSGSEARSTASSERSRSATRGTSVTRTGVSRPAALGAASKTAATGGSTAAKARQGLNTAAAKPALTGITSKGVGWARGKTTPANGTKAKTNNNNRAIKAPPREGSAARPVVSRAGVGRKGTTGAAASPSPPPPPARQDSSQASSPESATKAQRAWAQSPRGGVVAGESFNSMSLGGFDLSSNRSSITTADSLTSDDESNNRSSPRAKDDDDDDDDEPFTKVSGERGYGFRHDGRGAPNPEVVHDATAAVAWRRVLQFLRDSPEGAAAVEQLFIDMDDNGNGFVDRDELVNSLVKLGVRLDKQEFEAFQRDCDADGDGNISLAEFSSAVEARSVQTASEERDGWAQVLDKLLVNGTDKAKVNSLAPDERVEAAFAAADIDGNGELDIGELTVVLKALDVKMSVLQNALVRDAMDTNGDGTICLSEFQAVFAAQKNSARDMAWAVFLNFMHRHPKTADSVASVFLAADKDGNGELDVSELATVLVGLGIELDALQLRLFRDDIDANGDGAISLKEFQAAIEAKAKALGFELPPSATDSATTANAGAHDTF